MNIKDNLKVVHTVSYPFDTCLLKDKDVYIYSMMSFTAGPWIPAEIWRSLCSNMMLLCVTEAV